MQWQSALLLLPVIIYDGSLSHNRDIIVYVLLNSDSRHIYSNLIMLTDTHSDTRNTAWAVHHTPTSLWQAGMRTGVMSSASQSSIFTCPDHLSVPARLIHTPSEDLTASHIRPYPTSNTLTLLCPRIIYFEYQWLSKGQQKLLMNHYFTFETFLTKECFFPCYILLLFPSVL